MQKELLNKVLFVIFHAITVNGNRSSGLKKKGISQIIW